MSDESQEEVPKKEPEQKKAPKIEKGQSFDCDAVIPFSVKKNGVTRWYCIGEMSGGARDTYLSAVRKSTIMTTGADGKPHVEMKSFDGMSTMMLRHCVYGYDKETETSTQQLTDEATIAGWSQSLLDSLVETASELNTIGEGSPAISGND